VSMKSYQRQDGRGRPARRCRLRVEKRSLRSMDASRPGRRANSASCQEPSEVPASPIKALVLLRRNYCQAYALNQRCPFNTTGAKAAASPTIEPPTPPLDPQPAKGRVQALWRRPFDPRTPPISKSSILPPVFMAATSQRGCFPRPDHVSDVCGLRYFGSTLGYLRRAFPLAL
jgi:hypothetical protein